MRSSLRREARKAGAVVDFSGDVSTGRLTLPTMWRATWRSSERRSVASRQFRGFLSTSVDVDQRCGSPTLLITTTLSPRSILTSAVETQILEELLRPIESMRWKRFRLAAPFNDDPRRHVLSVQLFGKRAEPTR